MTARTVSPSPGGNQRGGFATTRGAPVPHAPASGLDASRPLSVSRVAARLAEIIDARLRGVREIWVHGEIRDLRSDARRTVRFTLCDGVSRIECVWWTPSPAAAAILSNGMETVVRGCPKIFTRAVGLVFVVEEARETGTGASAAAREQARLRLRAEGLFDPARKRQLPRVPRAVAVITGRSSAAWHDVLAIARRRHPGVPVVLVPAQMQGDAASASIRTALAGVEASGLFDVVVITRGGGGAAELTAFDDEPLVRAIATCKLPVVTAIGHEVDYSFADAVADCREPTPSAAAARVIPDREELRNQLHACHKSMAAALLQRLACDTRRLPITQSTLGRSTLLRIEAGRRRVDRVNADLDRALARRLDRARSQVAHGQETLRSVLRRLIETARPRLQATAREIVYGMRNCVSNEQERLRGAQRELSQSLMAALASQSARMQRASAQLVALNPLAVLSRGYVVVREAGGEMITSASQVSPGATLVVRFHDGAITVYASPPGRVADLTPGAEV